MNNTGMGLHRHFSIDRQSRHFACPFQAADDTMQMGVHTTLSTPQRKYYGSSAKNTLRWQQGFFSHCIKVTSCYQQSLSRCHYLPQMPSRVTCG